MLGVGWVAPETDATLRQGRPPSTTAGESGFSLTACHRGQEWRRRAVPRAARAFTCFHTWNSVSNYAGN